MLLKAVLGLGVLAGVGLGGAAVLGSREEDGSAGRGTLELHTVSKTSFDITTTSNGELAAKKQIEVRNPLERQATIVWIIDEGKTVKAGEELVRLNADELKLQAEEATLQLETAKAQLIEATEALAIQKSENDSLERQASLKVDLTDLALKQWERGEVESKRQDLRLDLEESERELSRLSEKYERSVALREQGYLSEDERKRDELDLEKAKAALEKAKLNHDVYEEFQHPKDLRQKNSDLEEAKAELERVTRKNASQLASKTADLNNKTSQLGIREERLAKLNKDIESATLRAPSDGLVVYSTSLENGRWGGGEGPLQIGQQVYPNQLVIALPDTNEMRASVRVHESLAARIRIGQEATVKVEAAGGKVATGKVGEISVLAEGGGWMRDPNTKEYTVKIDLDRADLEGLRPSMRCEAEIRLGHVDDAVSVPVQALDREGKVQFVHVPDRGKFVRRPVKVGRLSDRFAEITAGLNEGERVLLRRPQAGEVLDKKWTDDELKVAGLTFDPEGKIVAIAGESDGRGPRRARAGGAAPGDAALPGGEAVVVKTAMGGAETDGAGGAAAVPADGEEAKVAAADEPAPEKDGDATTTDAAAPASGGS